MKTEYTQSSISSPYKRKTAEKANSKELLHKMELKKEGAGPDYKLDISLPLKPLTAPPLPLPASSASTSNSSSDKKVEVEEKKDIPKKDVKKLERIEKKESPFKGPGVFFIRGLDIFSSPSKSEGGYAGMGRIAESVEGSRVYGWDQKSDLIKEIKKIPNEQPLVLVGHSLGGDTAIEIAKSLDSLEHKFRSVDLLVTLDAVGFNNDIIPQNVKKHINIFGENNFFLNDGPHVARNHERTELKNILSDLDHTDLDDSKEVQFEIVSNIEKVLSGAKKQT